MKGWYGNKHKHSLASRGIKTRNYTTINNPQSRPEDYPLHMRINYRYEWIDEEFVQYIVEYIEDDIQIANDLMRYANSDDYDEMIEILDDIVDKIYFETEDISSEELRAIISDVGYDEAEIILEKSMKNIVKKGLNKEYPIRKSRNNLVIEMRNEDEIPDEIKDELIYEYKRGLKFDLNNNMALESAVEIVLDNIDEEVDKFDLETNLTTYHTMERYLMSEDVMFKIENRSEQND